MKKVFFLFFIVVKSFSQAGTFDTTFDTDGIQTFCQSTVFDFVPVDAGIQSTGKIIQFCYSNNGSFYNFIRYNTDGSIDTNFGSNGMLTLTYNSLFQGQNLIRDFAVQSDDKILVAGSGTGVGVFIARYLPNGILDTSFNGVGYTTFHLGTSSEVLYNIVAQPDGNILVCGHSGGTANAPYFAVARITTNGVLDTTFGSGGIVLTAFSTYDSTANSIAVQPDGKIIVGGVTKSTVTQVNVFALVRFNPNGSVDTTFGTDGKVITSDINSPNYGITKLLVQPDGKIVAGGLSSSKMVMARYLPNGALDSSFGNNGVVFEAGFSSSSCDVVLQPDGKLLQAGGTSVESFKIFRYTATGVLDSTFANNANVFAATYGWASTVLLQNDLKILVFGNNYTSDFSHTCAVVIRLNNDVLGTEGFNKEEVGVFPNPSSGKINFITSAFNDKPFSIYVYNPLGQKVFEKTDETAKEAAIDLSELKAGTYFIMFSNNEKTITKTIILN